MAYVTLGRSSTALEPEDVRLEKIQLGCADHGFSLSRARQVACRVGFNVLGVP